MGKLKGKYGKSFKVADSRAVTNQAGEAALKSANLTIKDLIESEKHMRGIKGGSNKFGPVKL